ncbi:hypothetical protein M441DRAFT_457920 [Trichoderma asperellum CBS 433.97]|uniref:Uncharacterized protein n=1 Tax=Trichoderma asperellum (strain ATCC 204424 / CBS 433.97 / NBRC 101777) TaxID=1042311 RepID=A0A2T3ZAP6_TRIA4|nr:hypothetical protein M441DRAFT_457920 [Trichoderma asperellum CBS 433.97]PTB41877.1 hypothetical protein M441DRAFT_457920 [Trichoderma asperellum CBS 433.97]
MKPEIEVIQHFAEPSMATNQIPAILRKDAKIESDTFMGTGDYTRPPIAILVGSWYNDEMIKDFQSSTSDFPSLLWLRVDKAISSPPLGPQYSIVVGRRIKAKLLELLTIGPESPDFVHLV